MFRRPKQFDHSNARTVEGLFLAHYEQMFAWALHLTGHNHERAEDLVHDVFVQLRFGSLDLDAIENIEAYLFTVLRNLHRSQLARGNRSPARPALLVDYDSVEAGLRALDHDAGRRLQTLDELRSICQFVCARKQTAKAASALILRFFHGYYPSEIAQLLCTSRQAVAELLRVARSEVKVFLTEPQRLGFLPQQTTASPDLQRLSSDNLTEQLRLAIYATRQGVCRPERHVEDLYIANRPELIEAPLLAHFVSCPACMEIINRLLKLPSLDDRHPPDMLGPDPFKPAKPKASGKTEPHKPTSLKPKRDARTSLKKLERRQRDVYEHDPTELRVAVNGVVMTTHKLAATEHHAQALSIETTTDSLFIEIFSEQGVRLLFFHVDAPPSGAFEQETQTILSHGRTLTARITFGSAWPHLEIIYHTPDCGLQIADCGLKEESALPGFLFSASHVLLSDQPGVFTKLKSAIRNTQSVFPRLLRPVTITLLLGVLLAAAVAGQRLVTWFHHATLSSTPPGREPRLGKTGAERQPTVAPNAEPSPGKIKTAPKVSSAASPSAVAVAATTELEIEVLRLLQQAGADQYEQIEVRRTPQNKLRIEGILETESRKAELLQALASLQSNPAVEIHLQTVAEAAQKQRVSQSAQAPVIIEREEVTVTKLPVDAELRRAFAARGITDERMAEEIARFAATTMQRSRQAARHAGALRQLATRFSVGQLQTLDAGAREKWLSLIHSHARALRDEALQLRAALTPLFAANARQATEPITINNDDELRRTAEQLAALCAESDRVIRAAFTISADSAPAATIRSAAFLDNLHRIEHLAEAISEAK